MIDVLYINCSACPPAIGELKVFSMISCCTSQLKNHKSIISNLWWYAWGFQWAPMLEDFSGLLYFIRIQWVPMLKDFSGATMLEDFSGFLCLKISVGSYTWKFQWAAMLEDFSGFLCLKFSMGSCASTPSIWFTFSNFFVIFRRFIKNNIPQITRTLTLEPHTACRKGGWGLAEIN